MGASHCGNPLRFRLGYKKSPAIAVAMPWCTLLCNADQGGNCLTWFVVSLSLGNGFDTPPVLGGSCPLCSSAPALYQTQGAHCRGLYTALSVIQRLVSKCRSATLASVAAPPPGARQGFGGPNCPRHPTGGSGMGCDRAL